MANTLIIEAKDVNNNTVTTYSGTINMTSSDTSSVLANNITMTLTNGIAARAVYFGIAGTQTVTLTDVDNSALTAIATVTVNPIHFTISVTPTNITEGQSVNVTVTALDYQDSILSGLGNQGYGSSISFSSTDNNATYPLQGKPSNLISGVGVFNITLNTAGTQTITATNRDFNLVNATTPPITVNAAATPSPTPETSITTTQSPTSTQTAIPTSTESPSNTAPDTSNQSMQATTFLVAAIVAILVIIAILLLVLKKSGRLQQKSATSPSPPSPQQ
jgi:hypothetical protein